MITQPLTPGQVAGIAPLCEIYNQSSKENMNAETGSGLTFPTSQHTSDPARNTTQGLSKASPVGASFVGASFNEGWKDGRMDFIGEEGSIQAFPRCAPNLSSYKPEKSSFEPEPEEAFDYSLLWAKIRALLKQDMTLSAFGMWIEPCHLIPGEAETLKLAVQSDFSRNQILMRYGKQIRDILSVLADSPINLKIVADDSIGSQVNRSTMTTQAVTQQEIQESSAKLPTYIRSNQTAAQFEVENLWIKYGDLREIVVNSEPFQTPCNPEAEGGWGIGIGAMINACKAHTLEEVLFAIRAAKHYRGAKTRGGVFYHVLRNGLEADRA